MPEITVEGYGTFDVPVGTRLVRALENNNVDILHMCGGFARCTTCRVNIASGEPEQMTEAEYTKLTEKGWLGDVRLSCQILCEQDMIVTPVMTRHESGIDDPGPTPKDEITPIPHWRIAPRKNV
jgi:ferredoxin